MSRLLQRLRLRVFHSAASVIDETRVYWKVGMSTKTTTVVITTIINSNIIILLLIMIPCGDGDAYLGYDDVYAQRDFAPMGDGVKRHGKLYLSG